jgi:hypothetical protein
MFINILWILCLINSVYGILTNDLIPPLKNANVHSGTDMRNKVSILDIELIHTLHENIAKKRLLDLLEMNDSICNKMNALNYFKFERNFIEMNNVFNGGLLHDFEVFIE